MGGGAFLQATAPDGEPALNTPRMSPEEYQRLKTTYLARLQTYFPDGKVTCLIEAPEKLDYGDMDLLVAVDRTVDQLDLAKHLGAAGLISRSTGAHQSLTIGVLRDGSLSPRPPVMYSQIPSKIDARAVTEVEYAQLDITVIALDRMEWYVFYSAYGDMAGLLGHIVRNVGFTISDEGFWLRLQELDDSKQVANSGIADREGYLFLTRDPKLVMSFLGLSVERYEVGFTTIEQMYQWLLDCRFISQAALKLKRDTSNARQKERKRDVFSNFFHTWLPEHMDMTMEMEADDQKKVARDLRQQLRDEALTFFSKRQEYAAMHFVISRQLCNAMAINLLKPVIVQHSKLEGKKVTEILRAFKRHVFVDQAGHPYSVQVGHPDTEAQLFRLLAEGGESFKDEDAVGAFVKDHWEGLRNLVRS